MANLYPKITKDLTALANKFNDMSIYPVNAQDYKDLFFIIRQLGLDVSSLTPSSTVPTLDQVTTAGNTTTNTIDVGGVTTDYVQLDTLATPTPSQGMLYWDQDEETAGLQVNGLNYEIGQGLYWVAKNQTGVQINKGTAVYASGTLGASGRILIAPMIADGSIEAKYFLGITAEDIADGDDGKVITQGKVRQIDTTGYGAAGNVLWVSPTTPGALTQTQPTGTDLALAVAFVVHYASNGVLAVRVSVLDENSIGVIPTLDQVTTAGNTTTNSITVGNATVNGPVNSIFAHTPTTNYTGFGGVQLNVADGTERGFFKLNPQTGEVKIGSTGSGYFTTLHSAGVERMRIFFSSGNVGIGTTTDNGYKLQVNGDATINGVRVGLGGGSVSSNTAVGFESLNSNTTGERNTSIGYQAFSYNNQSGNDNTAVGYQALQYKGLNISGNTAIGSGSNRGNTQGANTTSVGAFSLRSNNASNNTAVGYEAAYSNTSGTGIIAIGYQSLKTNTTGVSNIAIGDNAMSLGSGFSASVGVGVNALQNNIASSNTAIGHEAARNNTSGTANNSFGFYSLRSNTTGNVNIAIGNESLRLNTTGEDNTGIGHKAIYSNISGTKNVGVGNYALYFNTASNNTAVGFGSSYSNTTGDSNVSVGYNSLYANSIGSRNSAFGYDSLRYNTDASNNTAFGYQSLRTTTSGGSNTALGRQAGYFNSTGSGNVFLGHQAGYNETGSDKLYIGNSSTNTLIYGDFSTGNVLIGTTTDAGYKLDVNGVTRVSGTGTFNGQNTFLVKSSTQNILRINNDENIIIGRSGGQETYISAINSGRLLIQNGVGSSQTSTGGIQIGTLANYTQATGTQVFTIINPVFNPTGYSDATFTAFAISPTINQSANLSTVGLSRGLYVNPTLVSPKDFRAIETTSGKIIHQGLTNSTQSDVVYYDSTTGELTYGASPAGATPTLDAVTTAGNTTTNAISVGGLTSNASSIILGAAAGTLGSKVLTLEGSLPELFFKDTFSTGSGFSLSKYGSAFYFVRTSSTGVFTNYAGAIVNNSWSLGHGGNPNATVHIKGADVLSSTKTLLVQNSSPTDLLTIWNDGAVGINTSTNAGYKLDVNGTARVQTSIQSPSVVAGATNGYGFALWVGNTARMESGINFAAVGTIVHSSTDMYYNNISTGDLIFRTSTNVERFRVFGSTGNVAIGTTTDAGYKLDVNGNTRVQGNLYFSTSGSYLYGDTNNIRLYDKNNSIILQSFPSGVANSETYLQSSSGNKFFRINDNAITLEWFNSNASDTTQKPINIIRGFFGNVLATDKTVLNITTPFFSNLTNATTLRGILIDINDTTTYTGFTTVRAIETVRGDVILNTQSAATNAGYTTMAVGGSSGVYFQMYVGANPAAQTLRGQLWAVGNNLLLNNPSSGYLGLYTTLYSGITVWPTTGNVYVGVSPSTDAGYKLDVNGTSRFTNTLALDSNLTFGANDVTINSTKVFGKLSIYGSASASSAIAIGYNSTASNNSSVSIGYNSQNSGDYAVTIGADTSSSAANSVTIGRGSVGATNSFVSGSNLGAITDVYFGSGVRHDSTNTAGVEYRINGSGASNNFNIAGGNIVIAGGKGTGTGTPGDVIFATSSLLGSSITLQSLTNRVWVKGDSGNVGIGTSSPESPLHVKYSSSTLAGITIENDGVGYNAGSMTLRSGTTGGVNMSATSSGGLYWFNLNTFANTLSLPATGNLIVGSAVDAGYRLDVQGGDARFAQNVEAASYSVAGNAGYSGIINFPGNPPGSQNLEFLQGILINVF